jgi:indoleacetamide hydrolase
MTSRETIHPGPNLDRRSMLALAAGVSALVSGGGNPAISAARAPGGDVTSLTAREVVRRIRRGELSAERYAEASLAALKAHADLNAVNHLDVAALFERARTVDRTRARGEALGSLAGLPIIVKDNINTVGFPTTAGTRFLTGYMPKANAPVAEALFQQGALLFAKSNMHELALGSTSANPVFGYVKNPYDLSRIPGGSSGGTAAAIAARIVPAGLGTDTAGSIRMPAHFCGIAGFRPSKSNPHYPVDGIVPLQTGFDVPGPMARNVADIALLHAAITHQPELAEADLRGVRIGLPRAFFWETLDADVAAIMDTAQRRLAAAGVTFVDVDLIDIVKETLGIRAAVRSHDLRTDLAAYLSLELPGMTMRGILDGIASKRVRELQFEAVDRPTSLAVAQRARASVEPLIARYGDVFRQNNITAIAFPTEPFPAPRLPASDTDVLPPQFEVNGQTYPATAMLRNPGPSPVLRTPGLSVPAGLTRDGLPVGIEIDGPPGGDDRLLSLGMAIEGVLGPLPPPTFRNANAG